MKTRIQKSVERSIGTFLMLFLCTNLFGQLTPACSPSYSSGSSSWNISNITVGSFTQTIAYYTHDYTSDSFDVVAGATNSISLTSHGYCSVGIAGDFNNDGDFDDPGEVMVLADYIANGTQTYTFDFAVPGTVLTGSYRFRAWNIYANSGEGNPVGSPCGSYGYGSWFDMTINVTNDATCQPPSNVQISDITSTSATGAWDASISTPSAYQWEVYLAGDDPETDTPVASGTVTDTSAAMIDLSPTTEYEFYVQSYCGASDLSQLSLPVSFFTLCDGMPTAGTPISADSSVCESQNYTVSIDTAATTGPGIVYQWQISLAGQNDWADIDGATGANYTTTQTEPTDYRYYVTCTGSDMSDTSGIYSFAQNPPNECYCIPGTTGTSYGDIITNVTFAGINNSSTAEGDVEGYADYTSSVEPGVVIPLATYDFSAHTGNGGNEAVSVWIDYNANGVFEADEYTYVGSAFNAVVTIPITIPYNATPGMTRMRVRVKYNSPAAADNPCGGYTWGETEDYAIEILALEECSGTPEPGMTILSTDTVCADGAAVNLSVEDAYSTFSGIQFQWQINTGDGWMDIENDTNATATVNVTQTSWFRNVLTCGNSGMDGASDSSMVEALALPDVSVSPTSFAVCEGGSAVLTATGASEYSWAPEAGLTATIGASVQASPENSTQYTVTGTSDIGCVNTATVIVSPISQVQVIAAASADGFCDPGELVVISLDGVPEGISGGGSWSYQWMDADSNEVQGFSPISNYSTTPSEDGNYSYFVNLVASSCSDDTLSHAAGVNFTVGFGADGVPALINCNRPLGSVSLSNGFGISSDSTYYTNDFSMPLDSMEGDSATLFNNANLQDGRLVLTNSQTSVNGAASIYSYSPPSYSGMDVYFDLTADTPINNFGTGGADGLAYSFGDDVETVSTYNLQNGSGSKLRLSFDAANNIANQKGIYLIYGYTEPYAPIPTNDPTVYGYSSNMDWKIQTDIPVHLHIDRFGKATLIVNGAIIFNGVQLPDAYLNADKSTWFSRFSAQTGGDALRQAVDNVQINYSALQYGITNADNPDAPTEWQTSTLFEGLEVGTYNVWMSNVDQSCVKQVGSYTITDINPVVDLASPINICEGESAVLDAQNEGSTYMWNTGDTTQTITVSETGNYAVLVTDTASCTDLGSAAVNVTPPSTVDAITMTSIGNDQWLFTAVNPTATETYFWEFGDGETETTSIPTVTHTYANSGSYVVTVTVSSAFGCEDGTASGSFDITVGINEIASEVGITLYPNPASDILHIENVGDTQIKSIDVLDATGKRVKQIAATNNRLINVDISPLQNGMYIVMINTEKAVYHTRFVVAR